MSAVGNSAERVQPSWHEVCRGVRNGPLCGLFWVLALEIFGASLVIPIFSFFCIHELKLDASRVGMLLAMFNLAQCLGGPTFGRISDAVGRRHILVAKMKEGVHGGVVRSQVQGFTDLVVVRTLAGLSGGSIPVATAMLMDCATTATRPRILGLQGCIHGATFTAGTMLVILLLWLEVVRRQIFMIAAAFCFFGFVVGVFLLQESLPPERRRPLLSSSASSETWAELFSDWQAVRPPLAFVWIARFLYAFCVFCLYATYSFLIKDNFGWSDKEFAVVLTGAGLAACVLEITIYPAVSARVGDHWCTIFGCLLVAAGMVVIPVKSLSVHFCGLLVLEVGQALCEPGLISLTALHAPSEKHMGFAQGVSNSFRALASFAGPPLAGLLYDESPMQAYGLASTAAISSAVVIVYIIATWSPASPDETERLLQKNAASSKAACQMSP
eukprot:TRINITY_DN27149_c0_g1_i2.p1 TRINITY_DN27149_c0_g1~~TRINITY_DN27149_c0_g1_i2.p1  ORF type:complete len:442 (+),score=60.26 TRINITY_DN27149_c0_g1_i2:137-1462(+)